MSRPTRKSLLAALRRRLAPVLFVAAAPLPAAEVPFDLAIVVASDLDGASLLEVADLDGDGDPDLVAAAHFAGDVAWFENANGDASSWVRHDLDTSFPVPLGLAVADLDGDGDPDVVAGSHTTGTVRWWANALDEPAACGGGTFCPADVDAALGSPGRVEVADLDRDGDLDLIVADSVGDILFGYENAGDGTTWTRRALVSGVVDAALLAVGDLDGDGLPDLVGAGNDPNELFWVRNDPGPGVCPDDWCLEVVTTLGHSVSAGIADVDGDGDPDLLRNLQSEPVDWWENTTGDASTWTRRPGFASLGEGPQGGTDVDGDGDLDWIGCGAAGWLDNLDGEGRSWEFRGLLSTATHATVATDLDGDGDLDFAGAQLNSDRIVWWRNTSLHRTFEAAPGVGVAGSATTAHLVHAADFDGDGRVDLVAGDQSDVLVLSLGDGTPADGGWTHHDLAAVTDARGLADGDFDGDGDLDLAVADNGLVDTVYWLENDGSPADGWPAHVVASGLDFDLVAAADLDRDGDLDLVAAAPPAGDVLWYENDGSPGDGPWTAHPVGETANVLGLAVADLDRDGDLDVATASSLDGRVDWFENALGDSRGSAWSSQQVAALEKARRLVACDVDGDGDEDLTVTTFDTGLVGWLENDLEAGTGPWNLHTVSAAPGDDVYFHDCGDFDGDGDADLVAPYLHDGRVAAFVQEGGNWTVHDLPSPSGFPITARLADLDRDGRTDVVTAGFLEPLRFHLDAGGQVDLEAADVLPGDAFDAGASDVPLLRLDARHLGRTGDGDAELGRLSLLAESAAGAPLSGPGLDLRVETLRLHRDDGDGLFDPLADPALHALSAPFALDGGVLDLGFPDGEPELGIGIGDPPTWWLVADLAGQDGLYRLRLTLLRRGPPSVDHVPDDEPVRLAERPDVTVELTISDPSAVLFADGFESGDLTAWSAVSRRDPRPTS